MRLYGELAPWFHLLTDPADYAEEADYYARILERAINGPARTLLVLGSGGGNNASHLEARFSCTLTDLSPEMLRLNASINPGCERVQGDMRTLRLGRTFDAVFVHDTVMYMTSEDDWRAVVETAATHDRPVAPYCSFPTPSSRCSLLETVADDHIDHPHPGELEAFAARRPA